MMNRAYIGINDKCYFLKLKKLSRIATRFFDAHLQKANIRGGQFSMMVELTHEHETGSSVASALGMDGSTLHRALIPLIRCGYVTSSKTTDKRVSHYDLTERGRLVLQEALPLWKTAVRGVKKAFPAGSESFLDDIYGSLSLQ